MLLNRFAALLAIGLCFVPLPASAQNQPAPIVQGTTSGDLRVANAQLKAQVLDLKADMAPLTGRIEQLEYMLSQSRDDINRMQGDDAQIEQLITRLEQKISDQAGVISTLTARLNTLEGASGSVAAQPQSMPAGEETLSIASASAITPSAGPTVLAPQDASVSTQSADSALSQQPAVQTVQQGTLGTLPASALPNGAGELFSEAKSRLLRFDYAGAEAAFTAFLDQFSDDPQAGAAQYWLAETLYQQNEYPASGQAYTKMIRTYPNDPLAPEALAKMARSFRLIGDTKKACGALDLLAKRYPSASGVTKNLAASERVRAGCNG